MKAIKVRAYAILFVLALLICFLAFCGLAKKAMANEENRVAREAAAQTEKTDAVVFEVKEIFQKPEEVKVDVVATAYCSCSKCCGKYAKNRPMDKNGNEIVYTASGARACADHTIAVDTDVFPFGTVLIIDGIEYVAEDTGSAIVGNKIDIYFDDHEAALDFGKKNLTAILKNLEGN